MTEPADPIAALASKDVHERAAAARALGARGDLSALRQLVTLARTDPSPAVRLGTAAAAADILARHRLPPLRDNLDEPTRRALLAEFNATDPAVNSALFSMLACLDLPEVWGRVTIGLRDPRGGVRLGAAVGLRRLCVSAAVADDPEVPRRLVALLEDKRLKHDSIAEVVRICAAVGAQAARSAIAAVKLEGAHHGVVDEALRVLDALQGPLVGAWESDGRDAGESAPDEGVQLLVLLTSGEDAARIEGGRATLLDGPVRPSRRMWLKRSPTDDAGVPAFQEAGRTWRQADDKVLLSALEDVVGPATLDLDGLGAPASPDAHRRADLGLLALRGEEGPELRMRGLLHLHAGRLEPAAAALTTALEAKRCPKDVPLLLAETLRALGRHDEARPHWESFLEKASAKAPFVELARTRLGQA